MHSHTRARERERDVCCRWRCGSSPSLRPCRPSVFPSTSFCPHQSAASSRLIWIRCSCCSSDAVRKRGVGCGKGGKVVSEGGTARWGACAVHAWVHMPCTDRSHRAPTGRRAPNGWTRHWCFTPLALVLDWFRSTHAVMRCKEEGRECAAIQSIWLARTPLRGPSLSQPLAHTLTAPAALKRTVSSHHHLTLCNKTGEEESVFDQDEIFLHVSRVYISKVCCA